MAEQILLSMALIAVAIIIGGVASIKLKFPPVVMLILLGMALGPYSLGLIENSELTTIFAELGGILLLFLIGTEFNFSKIMKLGLNSIIVAVIELSILFFLVYSISIALGFDPMAAVFIGLAISMTSTALTVKMLQDLQLSQRQETALLVGVSVIEDIVAVFVLGILSGLASGVELTTQSVLFSIVKSVAILYAAYFVLSKALKHFMKSDIVSEDNMVVLALGLALGLSFLASYLELSPAVGAFVAGNIIASLPQAKIFTQSIHRFGLFFISLFFLSIGILVNPMDILGNFYLIALLLAMAVIGKFVGVGLGTYFAGYSGQSAVFAGVAMIPIGEISLLIVKAGVDLGVLSNAFLGATAVLVLVTSLISYPAILHNEKIHRFIDAVVPKSMKKAGKRISASMSYYRYQLSVQGGTFKSIAANINKIAIVSLAVLILIALSYLFPQYLSEDLTKLLIPLIVAAAAIYMLVSKGYRKIRFRSGYSYKPKSQWNLRI